LIYGGVFGVIVTVSGVLGLLIPRVAGIPAGQRSVFLVSALVVGLATAFAIGLALLLNILHAYQRLPLANGVRVAYWVLLAPSSISAALNGWGVAGLAAAMAGTTAIVCAVALVLAVRLVPDFRPARPSIRYVRQATAYAGAMFAISLSATTAIETSNVIIASFLGIGAVAAYAVALRLTRTLTQFVHKVSDVLFPFYAGMRAADDTSRMRRYFLLTARLELAGGGAVVLLLSFAGLAALRLWVGQQNVVIPSAFALAIVLVALDVVAYPAAVLVTAAGGERSAAVVSLVQAGGGIACALALVRPFGVAGVIGGAVVAQALTTFWWLPAWALRTIKVGWGTYIRSAVMPVLLSLVPAFLLGTATSLVLHSPAVAAAVALLAYGATYLKIGAEAIERSWLQSAWEAVFRLARRYALDGAVMVMFTVFALLLFIDAWRAPFDRVIGLPGDPQLFLWYLRWPAFAVTHGLNPLFSNYIDYPAGINLMWNVSIPLPAALMSPITANLGPVFSYNLALTVGVALSGWTALLALRRYVNSTLAAVAGGLVYAFSPYLLSHAQGHLQASLVMLPPLLLILIDDIFARQQRHPLLSGMALGFVGAAQLLISEEVLAITLLTAVLAVALLIAMHPGEVRRHAAHVLKASAAACIVGLGLAGFPLWMQFFGPRRLGGALQPTTTYSNDFLNLVLPTPTQFLDPPVIQHVVANFTGNVSEWNGYLSIPLLVICVVSAVRSWDRAVVRLTAILGSMLALLSLGTMLHLAGHITPVPVVVFALAAVLLGRWMPARWLAISFALAWAALAVLPLWRNVLPSRIMLAVFLLAGVLVAVFIEQALQMRARGRIVAAGLTLALIAALFPKVPYPASPISVPNFFLVGGDVRAIRHDSVALIVPFARGDEPNAMVWQAASGMWFRMPEGYAYVPDSQTPADVSPGPSATQTLLVAIAKGGQPPLTDAVRVAVLADLGVWRVSSVVVGPMAHQEQAIATIRWLLGQQPVATGGVYFWPDVRTVSQPLTR
jgi:O-antigen/teichoic acid export membrane protein